MAKKRRYNTARIKITYSYTIADIEALYGVHKQTVRGWIKRGLPIIDKHRPTMIFGGDLKTFLQEQQNSRKATCKPHEIYCLKCRAPKTPWEKVVDIIILNERQLRLQGLCPTCDSTLNRMGSISDIKTYKTTFSVQTITNAQTSTKTHNSVPKP